MKTYLKQNYQRFIAIATFIMILVTSTPIYAKEKVDLTSSSRYITLDNKQMHIVLYGDLNETDSEVTFNDKSKSTLVMLPALGITSPHLYYKPLAQALNRDFNIVIVEPFGNGLSDLASTDRTVENINTELNQALEILNIDECVLLVHSISGVYGLNFVLNYPEKVKGFIAIDNTVYDDELQNDMAMEKEYMLDGIEAFNELRNSFPTVSDFKLAAASDPVKYGATLPDIIGYTYPESDMEEYVEAYSKSCNETVKDEVTRLNESLLTIKNKKFPDSLPVLMMIASANVENSPVWETAHLNQLNTESGNHEVHILEGGHYIWYTNISGVVEQITQWKANLS